VYVALASTGVVNSRLFPFPIYTSKFPQFIAIKTQLHAHPVSRIV